MNSYILIELYDISTMVPVSPSQLLDADAHDSDFLKVLSRRLLSHTFFTDFFNTYFIILDEK